MSAAALGIAVVVRASVVPAVQGPKFLESIRTRALFSRSLSTRTQATNALLAVRNVFGPDSVTNRKLAGKQDRRARRTCRSLDFQDAPGEKDLVRKARKKGPDPQVRPLGSAYNP